MKEKVYFKKISFRFALTAKREENYTAKRREHNPF